jgi:hypothetical protein
MKNKLFAALLLSLSLAACKNDAPAKAAEATKDAAATTAAAAPAAPTALSGTTCFRFEENKDVTICQITVDDKGGFAGYYDWSPFEKDGAHGILVNGKKEGDLYIGDYVYMIEGSVQKEEFIAKLDGGKLVKMRGEYEEKGDKLVNKDRSKLEVEYIMPSVDCATIAEQTKMIDQIRKMLK